MNENLNLVEILKDCPQGTKLYSPVYGEVEFWYVNDSDYYPIKVVIKDDTDAFTLDGRLYIEHKGECLLFPSNKQRDWSKFKPKHPKFNPKTLKPFNKVLARKDRDCIWVCEIFSHISDYIYGGVYFCGSDIYKYCIPYNDDTKYLIGKDDEAPEYYRYWED